VLERNDITTWRNAFLQALTEPPKVKPEIYVQTPMTAP
jgi:trehalose 6-phosphate synthase